MKSALKYIFYLLFFLFTIVVFIPKENLFYLGLQEAKKKNIEVVYKGIEDTNVGLDIEDSDIYYNKLNISNIEKIDFKTYLLYSHLKVSNVIVEKSFSKFIPSAIDNILVKHSILNPVNILLSGSFKEGTFNGTVNLIDKIVKIDLDVSNHFRNKYRDIIRRLKFQKDKSSKETYRYSYEYKF